MALLNYATQYQSALEQAYPYSLFFGDLYATPNNGRFRFVDAKTIAIPHLSTTGRVDSDRDTIATATRNYDNSWENKTLTHQHGQCPRSRCWPCPVCHQRGQEDAEERRAGAALH